jgi:trans-aconitate methyltransferase
MTSPSQDDLVARALAMARVRALRLGLVGLHKALIDAERQGYEREHGRIDSPHAALRLVLDHPRFQWLHPLAELVVHMDERLAEDGAIDVAVAEAFRERVRRLLHDNEQERFGTEYRRVLQADPDVVMAHAEVAKLVAPGSQRE